MWMAEGSAVARAEAARVWELWENVADWRRWDDGIEWSKLQGGFAAGTCGVLKPRGGLAARFTLIEVEPGRSFADVTHLPLARLHFSHRLEIQADGSTRIVHRAELRGPLGWLFRAIIGPGIKKGMPLAVEKLARLAEQAP